MTSHNTTIFPIKFKYNGVGFETKVLKDAYNRETLYKIFMPSVLSAVQQCWISLNKSGEYNLIMGTANADLQKLILTAIEQQEHVQAIYTQATAQPELKSA